MLTRQYAGPVRGVILDWAGTAVDHGCRGPVAVFSRAFEEFGVLPTEAEVRGPMGREKREHVAAMLAMPRLADSWAKKNGGLPDDASVSAVFARVLELMPDTLADFARPVPGCARTMETLRGMGIKIGSCTGYSRAMMGRLMARAEAAGFAPDCLVTADEVPQGRPWPWMCWRNCMKLGLFPPEAVVKVGDTLADVQEGINAGHWSVAVTRTSNALGLDEAEAAAMDPQALAEKEQALARDFRKAGAHYVISSIADLPALCEEISGALQLGRKP